MGEIIVFGSLNMDLVAKTHGLPERGETVSSYDFNLFPGGKGANQAVAIARLGGEVWMVGRVGNDSYGKQLLKNLKANNVHHEFVSIEDISSTGLAMIAVDPGGENMIIVVPGANHRCTELDLKRVFESGIKADYLLMQLEIPLEAVIASARLAQSKGIRVILNPSPSGHHGMKDIIKHTDVLVLNEVEAEHISSIKITDESSLKYAAKKLLSMGPEIVVITLGAKGAFGISGDEYYMVEPPEVTPVDTTAAGDAFLGGFAHQLARGKGLHESLRYATTCGALATTKMGAQPSLPVASEVLAILD